MTSIKPSKIFVFLPFLYHRRQNGQRGYVPGSAVSEIEPLYILRRVIRKENISVPKKVVSRRIDRILVPKKGNAMKPVGDSSLCHSVCLYFLEIIL